MLYTGLIFTLFLVVGRLVAETGAFLVQAYWYPCVMLWGIFGASALGVKSVLIMLILSSVLVIDPREAMMPFLVNAFKMLDLRRQKMGRTAAWCVAALWSGWRWRCRRLWHSSTTGAWIATTRSRWSVASQRPFDKAIEVTSDWSGKAVWTRPRRRADGAGSPGYRPRCPA